MSETVDESLKRLFEFFNEIGIINQLASTRFERVLPDGLTLSQFSVLNNFARLGGTRTPAQLAEAFQVTRGAMTNTLRKLEARGCIEISPDPTDGRSKTIAVTRRGLLLRERAIRAASRELSGLSGLVDGAWVEATLPKLKDLRAALDAARSSSFR
jgi:DNA-binding MarR family transcriptional regulator